MKGKLVRTFITAIIPGGVFGFLIYSMISQGMVLGAGIFAGVVLAIPTGMLHYLHHEKEEPSEN